MHLIQQLTLKFDVKYYKLSCLLNQTNSGMRPSTAKKHFFTNYNQNDNFKSTSTVLNDERNISRRHDDL